MARGILTRQQILGTFCQESGCQVLKNYNSETDAFREHRLTVREALTGRKRVEAVVSAKRPGRVQGSRSRGRTRRIVAVKANAAAFDRVRFNPCPRRRQRKFRVHRIPYRCGPI